MTETPGGWGKIDHWVWEMEGGRSKRRMVRLEPHKAVATQHQQDRSGAQRPEGVASEREPHLLAMGLCSLLGVRAVLPGPVGREAEGYNC